MHLGSLLLSGFPVFVWTRFHGFKISKFGDSTLKL